MDELIPGGLFTVFFLWGLWEWSRRMRRRVKDDNTGSKTEKRPDKVARIAYMIVAIAVITLVVLYIMVLKWF